MSEGTPVSTADDAVHMRRALDLARNGWGRTAPNPMVGAVVVRDGVVVGEGWHAEDGGPHAEVAALAIAGDRARGATVYVTLEPCTHHGRTGPCTDALLAAGVSRVVVAVADPNPVAAGGSARLRAAGVAVNEGIEAAAARELNAPFLHALASDWPFVTLKLALSLDGALADYAGGPGWLTGAEARSHVHHLRAGADAVAVGIGTALADDPELTVRDAPAPRVPPARVIFDSAARLPLDSRLVRSARRVPVIVVCSAPDPARAAALEAAGVQIVQAANLREALTALRGRGVRHLFVEGGAALASSFVAGTLVDRLVIFRAPLLLGESARNAFALLPPSRVKDAPRWRVLESRRLGDDELTVYAPSMARGGAI